MKTMLTIRNISSPQKKVTLYFLQKLSCFYHLGQDRTSLIPLPYDRLSNIWRQISSPPESNYIENGRKNGRERKEMELCMMNKASHMETGFFFFYPLPTTGLPLYNNYEKQSSNKFRIGNCLDLDKDGDRRSHTTSIFP